MGCSAAIIQAKKRRPFQNLAIEKFANRGFIQSIRGDSGDESVFAKAFSIGYQRLLNATSAKPRFSAPLATELK